jgi:hypothetical protein
MTEPIRICWLADGPHVVTEAHPVSSYVTSGERKDTAYGYVASKVIRPASVEDLETWRWA